jgi:outer membrane protein assembly factor BamB
VVECFVGSNDDKIHCVSGEDGSEIWTYTAGDDIHTGVCLADVDGDGLYEVLFGCNDNYLYCLESDGTLKWKYEADASIIGGLSVSDLDKDGKVEIFFGSGNYMYCLESD